MLLHAAVFFLVIITDLTFGLQFYLLPKLCQTDECLQLGNTVDESLDKEFSPCENFYKFSCNGWLSKTSKPTHSILWNQWQDAELKLIKRIQHLLNNGKYNMSYFQKTKQFYQSCITRDQSENIYLEELKLLIHRFGGLPLTTKHWNAENYNWLLNLVEITKILNVHPIIKLKLEVDILNTNSTILYISEGETILPLSILTNANKYTKEIQIYKKWIYQTLKHMYKILPNDVNKQIMEMIEFEIKLAKAIQIFQTNSKRTVLSKIQAKENFLKAFRILYLDTKVSIKKDSPVVIDNEIYLRQIIHLIHKTGPRVIANYLNWYLIKELSRDTTEYMRHLNFLMNKAVFGINDDTKLKDDCTKNVMDNLGFSLLNIYSDLYISSETVLEVKTMIENIKQEFVTILKQNSWLDVETKRDVVQKILNLKYFIGYPDWAMNHTFLENQYFKELKISDNHLLNVLQVKQFHRQKSIEQILDNNKLSWWLTPFEINAGYSILMNSMIIPAGMLEEPFFNINRPKSFNYGSLGYIIGHEISHSLDDKGRRANQLGKITTWWLEKDVAIFHQKIDCFRRQYENYGAESSSTIGENIADNVGLNISWAAFKNLKNNTIRSVIPKLEFYKDDQLFFISYAQTWCEVPSNNPLLEVAAYAAEEVRVLTAIENNKEFDKIFHCKNKEMNKKTRCTLW